MRHSLYIVQWIRCFGFDQYKYNTTVWETSLMHQKWREKDRKRRKSRTKHQPKNKIYECNLQSPSQPTDFPIPVTLNCYPLQWIWDKKKSNKKSGNDSFITKGCTLNGRTTKNWLTQICARKKECQLAWWNQPP